MKNKFYSPQLSAGLIMFLLITACTSSIFAQTWLAEGQTWQYEVLGGWNFDDWGLHTMQVEGDTVIHDKLCKKVVHYPLDSGPIVRFAYEENGQVFVYYGSSPYFIKIYDFNLEIGDTVQLIGIGKYEILEIGLMEIGNSMRKFQYVKYFWNNTFISSTKLLIEGIGLVDNPMQGGLLDCSYFFLENSFCDEAFDGWSIYFRCFQDGDFSYRPFNDCTLSDAPSPISEPSQMAISPNPANQSFTVKINGQTGYGRIELLNTTGQIVRHQPVVDIINTLELSVSDLPNGIYFVRLTNERGSLSKPIVVNH